jgi:hypothetical protein
LHHQGVDQRQWKGYKTWSKPHGSAGRRGKFPANVKSCSKPRGSAGRRGRIPPIWKPAQNLVAQRAGVEGSRRGLILLEPRGSAGRLGRIPPRWKPARHLVIQWASVKGFPQKFNSCWSLVAQQVGLEGSREAETCSALRDSVGWRGRFPPKLNPTEPRGSARRRGGFSPR